MDTAETKIMERQAAALELIAQRLLEIANNIANLNAHIVNMPSSLTPIGDR
jgi:hypothetical protein